MNYGECPICHQKVQMVYLSPEAKQDLAIGPHDVLVVTDAQPSFVKCLGSKKKPQEVPVAQE